MQNYVKKTVMWGHVTHFWNFGTPNFSGTKMLETSNLAQWWTAVSSDKKVDQRGSFGGHMTHFWNFGNFGILWVLGPPPPDISWTNEARNFKFGTYMEGSEY